jgi:hypothetical protein
MIEEPYLLEPKHKPALNGDFSVLYAEELNDELPGYAWLIVAFYGGIGLMFLWGIFVQSPGIDAYWDEHALTTEAVVTRCDLTYNALGNVFTHFGYEYEVNDVRYVARHEQRTEQASHKCERLSEGMTITIEYLPDQPQSSEYARGEDIDPVATPVGFIAGIGLSIYASKLAYMTVRTRRRFQRLRNEGKLISAYIIDAKKSRKYVFRRGSGYDIRYQFESPQTGKKVLGLRRTYQNPPRLDPPFCDTLPCFT